MNKRYITFVGSVLAVALAQVASATDVTIADPHSDKIIGGGFTVPMFPEAGRVENYSVDNNSWDLKKFDFNAGNNQLTMSGGFDFLTGKASGGLGSSSGTADFHDPIGDIFIYVGNAPYTVKNPGLNAGAAGNPINVAAAPDYVIAFDRTGTDLSAGLGYKIVSAPGAITYTGTGGGSALYFGLPWQYSGGGTADAGHTATYASVGTAYSNTFDNSLTVDLSSIADALASSGKAIWAHVTMQCGNDVMWGGPKPTTRSLPDGGMTLLMLGAGILGFGVLRRRLS